MGFERIPDCTVGENPSGSLYGALQWRPFSCKASPSCCCWRAQNQGQLFLTLLSLTHGFWKNTKLADIIIPATWFYSILSWVCTRKHILKFSPQNNSFRWAFSEECVGKQNLIRPKWFLKMLALDTLGSSMVTSRLLVIKYSVTYASGTLRYWAITIYYTISLISKKLYIKKRSQSNQ